MRREGSMKTLMKVSNRLQLTSKHAGSACLAHRQQLSSHTAACCDDKVPPLSPRPQDKRDEDVHSQELLTAELDFQVRMGEDHP